MSAFRDMGDVLEMAEGRNLTFIGDSMSSQHAHASECSWYVTQACELNYPHTSHSTLVMGRTQHSVASGYYCANKAAQSCRAIRVT